MVLRVAKETKEEHLQELVQDCLGPLKEHAKYKLAHQWKSLWYAENFPSNFMYTLQIVNVNETNK